MEQNDISLTLKGVVVMTGEETIGNKIDYVTHVRLDQPGLQSNVVEQVTHFHKPHYQPGDQVVVCCRQSGGSFPYQPLFIIPAREEAGRR